MPDDIRIAIIGGSGLGDALLERIPADDQETHDLETPFGAPSGPIITGTFAGTPIAMLQRHGPQHVYNPTMVPYRANIFALKKLGCTHVVATGATGSLREEIEPGDVVLCDQMIDRTVRQSRTFYERAAVHVEFADPICATMRTWLRNAAEQIEAAVHERGTYVCIEGPTFSTCAESHMHRQWGGDLVGMTAFPEARLVREAEMAYALVGLPTDYDCWRERPSEADAQSLLQEIIGNLQRATAASITLITAALRDISILETTRSTAHDALALGIWTAKEAIDPSEVQRLAPLWGRHFE